MKKAIRIMSLTLVLVLLALMAMGCGNGTSGSSSSGTDGGQGMVALNNDAPKWEVGEGTATVYQDSIGGTWVQVKVPVKNIGDTNLYLSAATMDLEDASGQLFDSISLVSVYPQVIQPGETAWYYEETTLDESPESDLTVVPHEEVQKATIDCMRYDISEVKITNESYGGIKVTGRVENKTEKDGSLVYVVAFLYDENDELLCQAFTILTNDLKAGDKVGFSATTFSNQDSFKAENVARYEVYAYPDEWQF